MKRSVLSAVVLIAAVLPLTSTGLANAEAGSSSMRVPRCPVETDETQGAQSHGVLSDRQAIEETMAKWAEAVRASDVETLASLVTEDAEFWTHGALPLVGREALISAFERFFSATAMKQNFDCRELILGGDWALLRGTESNELTPKGGGDTVVRKQRAFSVLRREPSGRWLFARGMTNLPPKE